MARYHLSKDGPMKCSAQIQCPLQKKAIENGEDPNQIFHYPNKATALEAYSEKLATQHAGEVHTSLKKFGDDIPTHVTHPEHSKLTTKDISEKINPEYLENEFYTGKQISGHINIDELDENSYKDFGFKFWTPQRMNAAIDNYKTRKTMHMLSFHKKGLSSNLSEEEFEKMTKQQKAVSNFYSGANYEWVNKSLRNKEFYDSLPDKMPDWRDYHLANQALTNPRKQFPTIKQAFQNYGVPDKWEVSSKQQSKELLNVFASHMDDAMNRASKHQKIVYRGMSNDSMIDSITGKPTEDVGRWLDENRGIGTVVEYDNYQSTSYNMKTAINFTGMSEATSEKKDEDAVLYEILTPEGVPISSVSKSCSEDEVILPRNRSYVIVGRQTVDAYMPLNKVGTIHVLQMVAVDKDNNVLDGRNTPVTKAVGE